MILPMMAPSRHQVGTKIELSWTQSEPSRHPIDSCLKKVSIILANSQINLVGSFVLNCQAFLYSCNHVYFIQPIIK